MTQYCQSSLRISSKISIKATPSRCFPMFRLVVLLLLSSTAMPGYGLCGATSSNKTAVCIRSERDALLEVKSSLVDRLNRLSSWSKVNMDCCKWHGVVCHRLTGHVRELHLGSSFNNYASSATNSSSYDSYYSMYLFRGNLSPSLLKLKHLRYLDLSNNNFEHCPIPDFLGSIQSLRSLNLSGSMFGHNIPHQLGNLSSLQYLNLGSGYNLHSKDLHWLSSLSSLKFLDLSLVRLTNASNWLNNINRVSSLRVLRLSDCELPNATADFLQSNFSSLSILDLSWNSLSAPSIFSWICRLQSLKNLNLGYNEFQGPLPSGLQNLSALVELDLSYNGLNSSIPSWLYAFGNLEVLVLQENFYLLGNISKGFENLTSLSVLDLSWTGLVGRIPRSFENFCNLRSLNLGGVKLKQEISEILDILTGCASNSLQILGLYECELHGHLTNDLGQFKSLASLDLGRNKLSGVLPLSLGRLENMDSLEISENLLVGNVYEAHFANLSKLIYFSAFGNKLNLRVGSKWLAPFQQINNLDLGSWHIGSPFPTWLRSLNQLVSLNLSNTGISGAIPSWFWKLKSLSQFGEVFLSQNKITQVVTNKDNNFRLSVPILDLTANILKGPMPLISSSVLMLGFSKNSLSGSMANFLCSCTSRNNKLELLYLEGNLLQGEIPDCWMYWGQLKDIRLSNNKFHGSIPQSFGTLKLLQSLHIWSNSLSGKLPVSLENCSKLAKLDVSDNQLEGSIPDSIGRWINMVILVLRGNKFYGKIPDSICRLISLQILDLAANSFNGSIPNCVGNFSAMIATGIVKFRQLYLNISLAAKESENQEIVFKGEVAEYSTNLNLVRSIDLSENNLSGVIPMGIANLTGLKSLSLSYNLLFGVIPENIGSMKALESLDFSHNQLSGQIPQSLADISFLSYLNLSHNNLSGRIPMGTQIQSFDASSFFDNKDLCGKPLSNNCSGDEFLPGAPRSTGNANANDLQMDWFYVALATGFIIGFLGVIGPLVFSRSWRRVLFFPGPLGTFLFSSF